MGNHAASCHAENQARVNRLEEYIENISMVGIGFHIKTTQGFLYLVSTALHVLMLYFNYFIGCKKCAENVFLS